MYVRPTSTRLFRGMLIPAIRAISRSPLTLLVTGVLADHEDRTVAADDLALLAHRLDRRSYLHDPFRLGVNQRRRLWPPHEAAATGRGRTPADCVGAQAKYDSRGSPPDPALIRPPKTPLAPRVFSCRAAPRSSRCATSR